MSPDELDRWLRTPRKLQPVADSLTMLDGFVTAIVAGPVTSNRSAGSARCSA